MTGLDRKGLEVNADEVVWLHDLEFNPGRCLIGMERGSIYLVKGMEDDVAAELWGDYEVVS